VARYAFLGPQGTFTEIALEGITSDSDERIPYANVTATLDAVRGGEVDFALVPIENSVEGVVARTLDELAIGDPLTIVAETTIPVNFALVTKEKLSPSEIKQIATHPHAEAQCRTYIAQRYPHAELVPTTSTAAAAQALSRGEFDAAIASSAAAEHFGLTIIEENIGDNDGAVTRFVLVQKPGLIPKPTGDDRTSVALFIDIDHAGALLEILTVFADHNVNLTFIQSRPTGRELCHSHFIIDVEGHCQYEPVAKSLSELAEICDEIRFLGSYPREARK
jgi:prephenate dehydratase